MTWPTTPVATTYLDQGTDEPRLARPDIKLAVDAVNAIAAEFGNVNVSGATNDQILVRSGNVWTGSNTINNLDVLAFDTAAAATVTTGQLAWNATDGTLDIGLNTGVTLQVGQETHFYGKAVGSIADGEAVMFAGAEGDHLLITQANLAAVGFQDSWVIGIATQEFANNDFGYVTAFGLVRSLDTTAYTAGDILYVDPVTPGGLTATAPTAPEHAIEIAAVVRSHATEGSLFVRPTFRGGLDQLNDVAVTAPVDGQVLQRSGNVWVNANVASGGGSVYALLQSGSNVVATVATNTVLASAWSEIYDPDSIVSINSSNNFELVAGTYILEISGSSIYVTLDAVAANQPTSGGDLIIYLKEVGNSTSLATDEHAGITMQGNSISVNPTLHMGNPSIVKYLNIASSTNYQLVYTAYTKAKVLPRIYLKITKIA